ncbi:MAG: radical SAM protein [Thermodesulfobacteriota bacterium]|nr:radical SAM protein [Thermodesulfobacteriota bacterium]
MLNKLSANGFKRKRDDLSRDSLEIKMTYSCRLRCSFCLFSNRRSMPSMTSEMVKKNIAYFLNKYNIREVVFSGGEPSEYKGLCHLIGFARDTGVGSIYLHTYAGKMLFSQIQGLCRLIDRIMISYHRVGGHSSVTDKCIERLLREGVAVRTNTLILSENCTTLPRIIQRLVDTGVRTMLFTYPFPLGSTGSENNSLLLLDRHQLKETIDVIVRVCEAAGINVTFQGLPKCFLRPHHHLQELWKDRFLVDFAHQFENRLLLFDGLLGRRFAEDCRGCREKETCNGTWPDSWHGTIFNREPFA